MHKLVRNCLLSSAICTSFIGPLLAAKEGAKPSGHAASLHDPTLRTWVPIKGAKYYKGHIIYASGQKVRVRTASPWLLLERDDQLSLAAFDERNRNLGKAKELAPKDVPVPSTAPALVARPAEPDVEIPPEPEEAEGPDPNVAQSRSSLDVFLGAGKEWMNAKGGTSSYDGASSIGGTQLDFRWQDHFSPWLIAGQIGAHYFNTQISSTDEAASSERSGEDQFLRLRIGVDALYDLQHTDGPERRLTTAVGAGLTHFRLPTLQVQDKTTGAATLVNRSVLGVNLAGLLITPVGAEDQVEGRLNLVPLYFSKDSKGMSTSISTVWRHDFDAQLHADLGILFVSEKLTTTVDCPPVSGCSDSSATTSKIFQARLGVGLGF